MGGLFKQPKIQMPATPTPPAPTPAPTIDTARAEQMSRDSAAMRQGRAATILTSDQGDLTPVETGAKKLMGE
jgi:hypothetical protein